MDLEARIDEKFGVKHRFGDELVIACPDPDHADRSPSCWVNVKKGLWICYSCGAGGRLEDLISGVVEHVPSLDEIEEMLDQLCEQQAETSYPNAWLRQFTMWEDAATRYWGGQRGLGPETIARFGLGYDVESDAFTYPIRERHGRVLGVVRRFPQGTPKYKYPKGVKIHEHLFGLHEAILGEHRDLALCEGAMDAMALWDVGIPALAQYGGFISAEQVRLLVRMQPQSLTICFDNDNAGRKAADEVIRSQISHVCEVRVVTWRGFEDYKDPAEVPAEMRRSLIRSAVPLLDFLMEAV